MEEGRKKEKNREEENGEVKGRRGEKWDIKGGSRNDKKKRRKGNEYHVHIGYWLEESFCCCIQGNCLLITI